MLIGAASKANQDCHNLNHTYPKMQQGQPPKR